jgi:hypothetical protein
MTDCNGDWYVVLFAASKQRENGLAIGTHEICCYSLSEAQQLAEIIVGKDEFKTQHAVLRVVDHFVVTKETWDRINRETKFPDHVQNQDEFVGQIREKIHGGRKQVHPELD